MSSTRRLSCPPNRSAPTNSVAGSEMAVGRCELLVAASPLSSSSQPPTPRSLLLRFSSVSRSAWASSSLQSRYGRGNSAGSSPASACERRRSAACTCSSAACWASSSISPNTIGAAAGRCARSDDGGWRLEEGMLPFNSPSSSLHPRSVAQKKGAYSERPSKRSPCAIRSIVAAHSSAASRRSPATSIDCMRATAWALRQSWISCGGPTTASRTWASLRWVIASKRRRLSISSPKNSIRSGSSSPGGKISTMPPRRFSSPGSSTVGATR